MHIYKKIFSQGPLTFQLNRLYTATVVTKSIESFVPYQLIIKCNKVRSSHIFLPHDLHLYLALLNYYLINHNSIRFVQTGWY